jgi:hypothetical protein
MEEEQNAELTHFMAMKANSWGKGDTKKEAAKQLRYQTTARGMISYYRIPKDYRIDEYGRGTGSACAVLISGKDNRE